jgi:ferric-dicitrate binding protein FerR (iron transport regulator)
MTDKDIHIEQLMMERIIGMISEDDARYLEGLLLQDRETRHKWEKINRDFGRGGLHHSLQGIHTNKAWARIKDGIAVRRRNKILKIRRLAIAGALMLPLFAAMVLFYRSKNLAPIAQAQIVNRNVRLYVGGRQTINLSNDTDSSSQLVQSNVSLKINNGSLSYVPLNNQVSHALNTLVVPATASYKLTLSDGTEVSLNSMSQLEFPFTFSGDKREVWLNGEAYFKVAKDDRHPFIVHTPLTEIRVLGTEFNVNSYDSFQVKTALVEGAVSTRAAGGKSIFLKPGYKAVFSSGRGFNVSTFDRSNTLSWMQGVYYFQNASLKNIATVIHRWYGDTVIFDDPKSSSSRFTGAMLKNKPLKEFLENLALTSNIRYYDKDGATHISAH